MTTAYLSHADCTKHCMGADHPEAPARIRAIEEALAAENIFDSLVVYDAPLAETAQLERVHDTRYVKYIFDIAPQKEVAVLDPDTCINIHSVKAALRACGAVVKATELVLSGEVTNAFCNVRPPGHHAENNQAMGFCIFNSITVGIAHALEQFKLERVAIVDFDVHYGNGTEDIIKNDKRILMCQSYQSPLYPYSGCPSEDGHIVNGPLPAESDGSAFRQMIEKTWLPQLHAFKPQIIFVSAGFDAHRDDPLADLTLTEPDYAWVTERIVEIANRYCSGRIVSSLEGGYNLCALAKSAAVHVNALVRGAELESSVHTRG